MIKTTRRFILLVIIALTAHIARAGGEKKNLVEWMSPEQAETANDSTKRPIIIDVYTSWCYYCKVMDNTTWRNDSVANYLTANYYTVKLNAENKDPYQWKGVSYVYEPKYKVNMLAVKLLEGNMVYPSLVIIPVKGEPEIISGAFSAKELEMILKYYGDRINEKMTPEEFMKKFSGKWK